MIIYPAIDIIDGQCVRLTKGDFGKKKKYFDDPMQVAMKWKEKGADWIHVIDLDGARTGKVANLSIAERIRQKTGVKVQYGGGIRDLPTLEKVLSSGIDRAILGTRAIEDRDFRETGFDKFGKKIIISLDFGKNGTIYKNGWQDKTSKNIFDFTLELEKLGLEEIIVTDIERDGTLGGTDTGRLSQILSGTALNFIIAGGISCIEDIEELKKIESKGISGVVAGKALYEGESPMDLAEAIRVGKKVDN
jgi:phosphoribosylformimino-5-aminoimidazole carboxamide ribotide isomerase